MIPRLFTAHELRTQAAVPLDADQIRYCRQVLRLEAGAPVRLFNGRDGEWRALLEAAGGKGMAARCEHRVRPQADTPALAMFFAPVKRSETDWIVQKSTELGVTALHPVITKRTQAGTVRTDRFAAIAREAAEQCERLDVPTIAAALPLARALDGWPPLRPLLYADEAGEACARISAALDPFPADLALLVGPEGGFDPEERRWLRGLAFVRPVSLGPRILRAETAVVVGLALIQAAREEASERAPL